MGGSFPFPTGISPAPLLSYTQFQSALRIEFGRARRYGFPLSCLVVAIDGLADLRDRHGVEARDEVLSRQVSVLKAQLRSSDFVGQFQDRLTLLLPHATSVGARAVAERFQAAARVEPFNFGGEPRTVTASVGIATLESRATLFFDSLFKSAEQAVSQALAAGAECIVVAASGNR